jgi:GntR family transcriptional repressor for pyruvate dehydrogenase complex
MVAAERVRVPKTAELVAAQLRRQIVLGQLKEGDALPPEATLMAQYGVSRPTLREAFRVLESEALISIRRGSRGGAQVHTPSGDVAARYAGLVLQYRGVTLGDVHEARLVLEPPAAAMLASRRTKKTITALEKALAAEAASVDDPLEFARTSAHFHEQVLELAGNKTLAVFADMLESIVELHLRAVMKEASATGRPTATGERRTAHKAHARLVELVKKGDADAAADYWKGHLEGLRNFLLGGSNPKTVVDLFG